MIKTKRIFVSLVMTFCITLMSLGFRPASVQAASTKDFVVINLTQAEIYALYVSPSDAEDWGEDILTVDTLPNEEMVEVQFDFNEDISFWDLRAEDQDGNAIVFENVNVDEIWNVTLGFVDEKPVALMGKKHWVNLNNATGVDIYALYLSPTDTDAWGEDVLDVEVLSDGEEAQFMVLAQAGQRYWDLRIEDSDGNAVTWTGLDITTMSDLKLILKDGEALIGANYNLDFTLTNNAGLPLYALYLSPAESNEWGEDILGLDILEDGTKANISFAPDASAQLWDLRIEDQDGGFEVWKNIDLSVANEITIVIENKVCKAYVR